MAGKIDIQLKEGDLAPDFTAPIQGGKTITLSNINGPVVLYFYPRDDTPGCTREACGFRDLHPEFTRKGVHVLGVSVDPVKSHDRFAGKYNRPFTLVADENHEIVKAYGVWAAKTFMGKTHMGTCRVTFLIGKDRRIRRIWTTVKPDQHPDEVLKALES